MRWKDLHYIRRSDRRVLWFLLVLLVAVLVIFLLTKGGDEMTTDADLADSSKLAEKKSYKDNDWSKGYYKDKGNGYYAVTPKAVRRFPFDPNTADSTQLLALGLSPWQVRNIYKYRAAGGIYRRKQDFGRVYGMTNKQFRELEPYIHISDDFQPYRANIDAQLRHDSSSKSIVTRNDVKLKAGQRVELNGSDSTQLMRVPGIGRYYARQIENRRKWLGGFYTTDQLLEIDDFPKDAINYFYVNESLIKKININKASLSELKRHPYINYYQARDILDYRRLRGSIKSLNDLRLLKDFTEQDINRLKHYVEY